MSRSTSELILSLILLFTSLTGLIYLIAWTWERWNARF